MTHVQYLAYVLGLQTDQQVGFLFCVVVAFSIGWLAKEWRDKIRVGRWKRALWRGDRLGVWK